MEAHDQYLDNLGNCGDDGFEEVEIELEPQERATITVNQWIRAGAKILGFPNGEVQ